MKTWGTLLVPVIYQVTSGAEKFASFGANVIEVDGHNHDELQLALKSRVKGKPTVIVAHTIKGKGVSFMENNNLYHSACAKGEDLEKALREIENQ